MKFPPCFAILAIALSFSAVASPVVVGDYSFEANDLSSGEYDDDLEPEWKETNGPQNANGFEEYISGFVSDGTDHLGMDSGHDVWQDLGVTYQANTRYTLTLTTGHRSGYTQPSNQSEYLLADDTGAIYGTGTFNAYTLPEDSFGIVPPVVFETADNPAAVGKIIRILLRARGDGRSHFDKIQLDAAVLIPPGGAAVSNQGATAITPTSATLNGVVTGIGNQAPSITLFWGTTNGDISPAAWQHSLVLPGTHTGAFSGNISGLTAGVTYYFTSRATNSAGDSWAFEVESFEAQPLPPAVANVAATEIGATVATVGANVTATGGGIPTVTLYYGPADGGTNPANWASSVDLGSLNGIGTTELTGLTPGTLYRFRARAVNAGGTTWASVTSTFTTPTVSLPAVQNRTAEGITGTTANLRGEVTNDGNNPPVVTIFYGTTNGGTNAASWASSISAGVQSGDYSFFTSGLNPQTTYFFRSRAVNSAGTVWAPDTLSFTTTALVPNSAVIQEIHYKPADKTQLEEFIELHNPGDTALNLAGWTLSDAVTYTFPVGTTLPAGGYLIIAESPSVILSRYGKTALGPWTGKLNSTGERIDLKDGGGVLKDSVNYGAGYPWPTNAAGGGSSVELMHPGLDNDLGGSWRSSFRPEAIAQSFIDPGVTGWKYKKMSGGEASTPVEAWRFTGFSDGSWISFQTGIGYGTTAALVPNTEITDMFVEPTTPLNYKGIYARKEFAVPAFQIPDQLTLRVRYDDGCIVWINGTEVHRDRMPAGHVPPTSGATSGKSGDPSWTTVNLTGSAAYLLGGTNVLAIQALNYDSASSSGVHRTDFYLDAELDAPAIAVNYLPSPGLANTVKLASTVIPPQTRQVAHSPVSPAPGQIVTVTAKITDPDGMGAVSLAYQTVNPGAYIRLTDPAYATSWTTLLMKDNGLSGDATAGDSIYTVRIPASVQTNRRLVRYKITCTDDDGNTVTVPYAEDEQPNFAYYVYSGLPAWQGAFRPGTTAVQTFPTTLLDDLPVYSLIANGTDVIDSQYHSGFDATRFRGTFVYDGIVYDHVEFRNRGEASTYIAGKNKWRFFFNRTRDLPAKNNFGEEYSETWNGLSGDACASPWAPVHRGMAGVEEATAYKVFQLAGVPSPHTHYYHFRVVRGATETPAAGVVINDPIGDPDIADGQYAGDFWGLYLAVEQPDGSFLDERGLPDGNVYKIGNGQPDKKNQYAGVSASQPVTSTDWTSFLNAYKEDGDDPTEAWWRANMDMDAYYTFQAMSRLTGNVDLRGGYNHYFYHRSTDNRWVPMPWDLDMMFIAKSHKTTDVAGGIHPGVIYAHKSVLQHPALALEYRNRCREILDLMGGDGNAGGGQIGQLIDEFAAIVNPAGQALTWADADAAMWNVHPQTTGNDGQHNGQNNHRGNFYYTTFGDTRSGGSWTRWLRTPGSSGTMAHEDSMIYLRDYTTNAWPGGSWTVSNGNQLGYGYQYLVAESGDSQIPLTPVATFTGDPGFPISDLKFNSSAFSDPQGSGTYAKTQWRLAEIAGPGVSSYAAGSPRLYEIQPLWTAEFTSAPGSVTIPFGIATAGKTYRVRVRHQDTSGRWSHWSVPAQFAATPPPPGLLLHYWNFNPANQTNVTQTIGGGVLTPVLTGTAAVVSDSGEGFTGENARNGNAAGNHLRVNNPLGATLNFALPTTGYQNIVIQYETRRSGQGAGLQQVSYTTNGTVFTPFTTITVLDAAPVVQVLDFRGVPAANDNPLFGLRITFQQGAGGTAGNNRFDNFTLEGDLFSLEPDTYAYWRTENFPNPGDFANDAISGPEAIPGGDGIANIIRYALGVGPHDPVAHLLPVLVKNGGSYQFRFRYDPDLTDLVWKVKGSNNLTAWPSTLFDSDINPIPPLDNGWLPLNLPANLGGGPNPDPKIFARLELQLANP